MQVTVAHAGRRSADQDLVRAGLVDLNFFDGERLFECTKNCGFHPGHPLSAPVSIEELY
jgi:hypothetical protein